MRRSPSGWSEVFFCHMRVRISMKKRKRSFLPRFGWIPQEFSSRRVQARGKNGFEPPTAAQAHGGKLRSGIRKSGKVIRKLKQKMPGSGVLPEKSRLTILGTKLPAPLAEEESPAAASLFGFPPPLPVKNVSSKKTDAPTHADWKKNGQAERRTEFFLLGSEDKTPGNPSCQARVSPDRNLSGFSVAATGRMGEPEPIPGFSRPAFHLRPKGDPPGSFRRRDGDRENPRRG
ncbi:hypothetical protein MPNT_60099 [Candidatus Methylacidithermus pantelleriae]|uniref:Uncharacterized protein n=1 Tax=Candidatus Methylacidithermus pantelleriae TaxID=2744239 RepID=A0A8J2BPA9_9BACT|nr:hypothetical protein MPNT_60099 [Candidatus Methylacidithermus pantelleriae]